MLEAKQIALFFLLRFLLDIFVQTAHLDCPFKKKDTIKRAINTQNSAPKLQPLSTTKIKQPMHFYGLACLFTMPFNKFGIRLIIYLYSLKGYLPLVNIAEGAHNQTGLRNETIVWYQLQAAQA